MGIFSSLKSLFCTEESENDETKSKYEPSHYKQMLASKTPETILEGINGHNMSMNLYKVVAIYVPTNRKRTIQVYGFSEQDAIDHMGNGYKFPPMSIENAEYQKPSREQISYMLSLGVKIPDKCCKEDASALISMKLDEFENAPAAPVELKRFADSRRIPYSLYLNEPHLLNFIYKHADSTNEKIALMVAAMYREVHGKWDFSSWSEWFEFGEKACNDKSFMNSFKRNADEWGEFFGSEKYSKSPSNKTVLYQTINNYLKYQ